MQTLLTNVIIIKKLYKFLNNKNNKQLNINKKVIIFYANTTIN